MTAPEPHEIFLAGSWVDSPERLVVANPARADEPAGSTYYATEAQYEEAVVACVAAFEETRRLPAYVRSAALRKIADGIAARRAELARIITIESGKPIRDSLTEVDRGVLTFRLGAEEAERIGGEVIPLDLNPASRGRTGIPRRLPAYVRSAALRKIADGIAARRAEIARIITIESGKPIRDSLTEVDRGVLTFRLGGEGGGRIGGEVIPLDLNPASRGRTGITRRFPIGPIAAISPFNFPLNLAAHKLAPAIASGNPIVLKAPSKDPLTILTVAEVIAEVGLPMGSVSILPMTRELGDRLVTDDRFKLLTFTGSPDVGWKMKERAARAAPRKRVVLELGGNAGAIVDRTADLDWAVRRITVGAFSYSGQVCNSVQRVFVHETV